MECCGFARETYICSWIDRIQQVRAEFDQILLDHARESKASVYEQIKVTSIHFCSQEPFRPVAAEWTSTCCPSQIGVISFEYLVDATGRAGLMSTKYMHNRHYNEALRNIAVWGYWKGTARSENGTSREGAPRFEVLQGETSHVCDKLKDKFYEMAFIFIRQFWVGLAHTSP